MASKTPLDFNEAPSNGPWYDGEEIRREELRHRDGETHPDDATPEGLGADYD